MKPIVVFLRAVFLVMLTLNSGAAFAGDHAGSLSKNSQQEVIAPMSLFQDQPGLLEKLGSRHVVLLREF